MKNNLNSLKKSQPVDFTDLINSLKIKITNEITKLETKKKSKENKVKIIDFLHKYLGHINIISLIIAVSLIFGLFGLSGFLMLNSYNVFHTLSISSNIRETSSVLLFISGIASSGLGIATICKFESIFDSLCSFFDTTLIRPLDKLINKSKTKNIQKNKEYGIDISYLRETLKSLTTMQENFKYLIHSSQKDKIFTEKEVKLIYKHLTSSNITALIHLLYHDKTKDIKHLSIEEKEQLAINLEHKIAEVKAYAEQLQNAHPLTNSHHNDNQRHRRMERFHTYPHDDILDEVFSDIETSTTHKGRR